MELPPRYFHFQMLENLTLMLSFETAAGQGVEISHEAGPNDGRATLAVSVPGDRLAVSGPATQLLYDLRDALNADAGTGWTKQLRSTSYDSTAAFTVVDAGHGLSRLTLTAEGVSVNAELSGEEQADLVKLLNQYFGHLLG